MEDLLKRIVAELQYRGLNASINNGIIELSITIENISLNLECNLGDFFPYEFPTVKLSEESTNQVPRIPHICDDNSICIFDKGVAVPNFKQPVGLACETICKAIEILRKGILGENQDDFIDEFNEYWKVKNPFIVTFIEDYTTFKKAYFAFPPDGNKGCIIATDSYEQLYNLYYSINYKEPLSENVIGGIIVPLDIGTVNCIPKSDIDIYNVIRNHSSSFKQYKRYMQHHIDDVVYIILAQPSSNGTILFGWIHFRPGVPKGFRRGHVDLAVAFSKITGQNGLGFSLENCSQPRLFSRGGDGLPSAWRKVCIVGCGSVGSVLANSLLYSGVLDFTLVDNEPLSYENIARHIAGFTYVGMSKVMAMEFILRKHNPNIVCSPLKVNAHDFLEKHQETINSSDILFMATASIGVENHLCDLINCGKITVPSVIIWLEPYAIGGHALVLKGPQNLYEELFDSNTLEFTHKIVANYAQLSKRESGCQSTYVPYSGAYLQMFVFRVLEQISTRTIHQNGNYLVTWCGKISDTQKYSVQICDEYKHVADFSIIERRID